MLEGGNTVKNKDKYLLMLKTLYAGNAGKAELEAVAKAIAELTETEQVEFNNFQHTVGEHFLKVREELDEGLTAMADQFPEETDPRKWDIDDWYQFSVAIEGHKYAELYRTYSKQEPNIHLVWAEIESRL